MSDEQTQAPVEDTPADLPGPDSGTPGTEVNWQERYANLQPEYTRASQEAAQLRNLVEAARQGDPDAISQLGFEIADSDLDDTPEYEDPFDEIRKEVEEVRQWKQSQEQQAQEAQMLQRAEQHIETEINAIDGLDEADAAWVVDRALRLPPNDQGLPDIQAAAKDFAAWDQARQERYAEQQRQQRRRRPAAIAGGQEGTDAPNWDEMSPSQQAEYMASRVQALNES